MKSGSHCEKHAMKRFGKLVLSRIPDNQSQVRVPLISDIPCNVLVSHSGYGKCTCPDSAAS